MKRIESYEDDRRGVVTYEFDNGHRVCLDASTVLEVGLNNMLRNMGLAHHILTKRLDVMQSGQRVGTVAPDFDPRFVKSNSLWYEPRPGDFRREGDVIIAHHMMGPGDLLAVVGFRDERTEFQFG